MERGKTDDSTAKGLEERRLRSLADAMGHPVRSKILFAIADKPGATIRKISERVSESPRRVRYHLEKLVEEGLVLVDEESFGPATIERRYRAARPPVIDSEAIDLLRVDQWRKLDLEILKAVFADARAAITAGTFGEREGHCNVRWWAEVDQEGWEELAQIHQRAYEEVSSAIAKAKARIATGGKPAMAVTSAIFLFEVPPWDLD